MKHERRRTPLRAVIVTLATAAILAPAFPAEAATLRVRHFAPVPCTVVCAYWIPETLGYDPCDAPFPEGSYDRTTFRLTSKTGTTKIWARSPMDYDTFVCTDTNPPVLVTQMANSVGSECDGIGGRSLAAFGCLEEGYLTYRGLVSSNGGVNEMRFLVVSYNWSDLSAIHVNLRGPVALVSDRYQANCAVC